MKKIITITIMTLLVILVILVIMAYKGIKDRHPGYNAGQMILSRVSSPLHAGFAAVPITPEVPDRWVDTDNDGKFNSKKGDTFTDGNGNGKFDPVWIAGFSNNKPANGIHDDTWARTMIIDDGKTRLAVVSLDAIGFMHDDVVDVRKMIPEEAGITYLIISSTHTHEGPDLLGLWGKSPLKSGVNPAYMVFVKSQIVQSVVQAAKNLKPAKLEISEDLTSAIPQVKDTRMPQVFDSGMRIIRAIDRESGATLGSLVAWANHPETLWSQNLLISSDFPHYVREGVENGVYYGDSLVCPGIGGVCVYVNGALGGLMTTHPSLAIKDPFTGEEYLEPTYQKTEAQGKQLAMIALKAMADPLDVIDSASVSLISRTLYLPIANNLFKLATILGVMDRGTSGWMKMRTELAVVKIGPVSIATLPGEVYPEIINGPVEAPEGGDYNISPVETPPLRELMPGKYKFILGLANDEIGYIIPKSQWDAKAPFTYGRDNSPYGEENSLGPETAPTLHANLKEMLEIMGD